MKVKAIWIDDDSYRAKSLLDLLDLYGINTILYSDLNDALMNIRQDYKNIDVIILDILMPPGNLFTCNETNEGRKTGILLYEKIRDIFKGPIIFYSVLSDIHFIKQLVAKDSKLAYLQKPTSVERIIKSIMDLCK
jgi:DNA-binding NtrC family response regulator